MATRAASEPSQRPEIGDTLVVIHDFQARSSDELSLSKGDRVELIERDDEFGDGWFLGRHLVNDNTGLFPEVYTRPAPKNVPAAAPSKATSSAPEVSNGNHAAGAANVSASSTPVLAGTLFEPSQLEKTLSNATASSLQSAKPEDAAAIRIAPGNSPALELSRPPSQSHDNKVLNDTLNVINEHITHLRSSPSNGGLRVPAAANDSGSEYSMPVDPRMSYIQGEETDEEEDREHTRPEVESWNADQVAQYLFEAGVEKQHCEVFRDQEISGEVLLGMDQSSLFIKAFDLGSVGRRLKTWHKIKALQDEVSIPTSTRRTTRTWGGSDAGSEDVKATRSRTSTNMTSMSNRMSSSQGASSASGAVASPTALRSPLSPGSSFGSPTRPSHIKRPSAASVREIAHSRRHSSIDYRSPTPLIASVIPGIAPAALSPKGVKVDSAVSHKKQASFDRNWTLGNASPPARPLSSAGLQDLMANGEPDLQDSAVDLDRGYFSGTETDGKRRNLLRKRDGAMHSKKSSYTDEQRVRSATALSRHSRFSSVDSMRDHAVSSAVQKYFGVQSTQRRRTTSTNTAGSVSTDTPVMDSPAPIVTRIDTGLNPTRSPSSPVNASKQGFASDWLSAVVNKPMGKGRPGMRAISDKLSSNQPKDVPSNDGALESPGRPASSTASGEPSLDIDSPPTGQSLNGMSMNKNSKKKGKKETSAYTRGLQKIPPAEAKIGADYCGWMKKKSSNLMTTWKPRFFVLKGRRLAYYYSEEDDQEKGLIDISFHRVLPAGNERLTGLHAQLTGAGSNGGGQGGQGVSPNGHESKGGADKTSEPVFIFKLMPPRAGLSRAVNFTKPTVHYFALPNIEQGRLWMAALMKATIDRDDSQPITTTYQQKTISLSKAKQMRHRPPALMNLDEAAEDDLPDSSKPVNGLGILGEADSGVSGVDKIGVAKSDGSPSESHIASAMTGVGQSA